MSVLLSGFVCGKRTHARVVFCSARHHHIHFASPCNDHDESVWFGRRALNRSIPSCHRVHTKAVARVRPARSCCNEATRASTLRGPQGAIFSRNVQFSGSCLHIATLLVTLTKPARVTCPVWCVRVGTNDRARVVHPHRSPHPRNVAVRACVLQSVALP